MKTRLIRIIIAAALFTISFAASAQIYIGGSIGGAYGTSSDSSTKSWALDIKPEIGYAFNENWAIGGRVTYGKSVSKTETPSIKDSDIDITLLTINPYAAVSAFRFRGFAVWAEFGVQVMPEQYGVDFTTFAGYITPVLTYNIGRHITLKTDLNFAGLAVTGTTEGELIFAGSIGGDDAISFNDDLSIGFVFRF